MTCESSETKKTASFAAKVPGHGQYDLQVQLKSYVIDLAPS
jgi:hypothetical protein